VRAALAASAVVERHASPRMGLFLRFLRDLTCAEKSISFDFKGYLASFGHFRCDLDVLLTTAAPLRERHSHIIADSQSPRSTSMNWMTIAVSTSAWEKETEAKWSRI